MVMGSYLHGSFDLPAFRRFFLSKACRDDAEEKDTSSVKDYDASVDESIERIASALQSSLDMNKVYKMLGMEARK
jgi:cobyric acid synthase